MIQQAFDTWLQFQLPPTIICVVLQMLKYLEVLLYMFFFCFFGICNFGLPNMLVFQVCHEREVENVALDLCGF